MRKLILQSVLLSMMMSAAGCMTGNRVNSSVIARMANRGVLLMPINDEQTLCVINTADAPCSWFVVSTGWPSANQVLTQVPEVEAVHGLLASENRRHLAVVVVGEGHPDIEIVDLPKLLADESYAVRMRLDPYPGAVGLEHWENGELVVWSDMLLTRRQGPANRVPPALELPAPELFALNVETGAVSARGMVGQAPVKHYEQGLKSRFNDTVLRSAAALKALQARESLPALRLALATTSDPKLKEELQAAIKALGP